MHSLNLENCEKNYYCVIEFESDKKKKKKRIDEIGRDKESNNKEGIEIEIEGNGFQNDTSLP